MDETKVIHLIFSILFFLSLCSTHIVSSSSWQKIAFHGKNYAWLCERNRWGRVCASLCVLRRGNSEIFPRHHHHPTTPITCHSCPKEEDHIGSHWSCIQRVYLHSLLWTVSQKTYAGFCACVHTTLLPCICTRSTVAASSSIFFLYIMSFITTARLLPLSLLSFLNLFRD